MLMHPRPDHHHPTTRSPGIAGPETTMFDHHDLFLRERLKQLRDAATLHPQTDGRDGVVTRTRRTIGRGLIAVGSAVAGAGHELRELDPRDARDAGLAA